MRDDKREDSPAGLKETRDHILTFLYQSIGDMQTTIRSIDTKLGFILVLNIIPITNIGKIYSAIYQTCSMDGGCAIQVLKAVIIAVCAILWLLACVCTYKGITAIDDPRNHISGMNQQAKGSFYSGGLYARNFVDAILNRPSLASKKTFSEYRKDMPETDDQIFNELLFDKMKLAYIRDTKLNRQKWAFRLTVCWVILSFIIYAMITRVPGLR